jgi:hypothetical protein
VDRLLIAALVLAAAGVLAALWRSRPAQIVERVNPLDFGLSGSGLAVAGFTGPMCHACQLWREQLEARGVTPAFVDVKARPDLAHEYGIRSTPMVYLVDVADGRVERSFSGEPLQEHVDELHSAVQPALH